MRVKIFEFSFISVKKEHAKIYQYMKLHYQNKALLENSLTGKFFPTHTIAL